VDSCGRTVWIADAHRDDRKRFVARSEEKLTAFLELERVTPRAFSIACDKLSREFRRGEPTLKKST
jgi:hypothetical protein